VRLEHDNGRSVAVLRTAVATLNTWFITSQRGNLLQQRPRFRELLGEWERAELLPSRDYMSLEDLAH
jgi:hypothetical protein